MADSSLKQRRRGSRTAPFCLLTALLVGLPGCVATKGDVRTLQDELAAVQARQDSLVRAANRQNRILQDSIAASTELMRTMRGQLVNQITQVQELLLTVQQLLGQNEQRLAQLREQMEQQRQSAVQTPTQSSTGSARGNFDEMYAAGMTFIKESPATARATFQRILSDHPQDERLPDVQFYIAETYYEEGNFEQAYREYELVVSSYPNSDRARKALYRAGVVAEERKNTPKAREYYSRVSSNYPNTDEARQADQALRRLRR
jgi:tol-pal system protein YbgF